MSLYAVPISQKEAFAWVARVHRHLDAPEGSLCQVAAARGAEIVGVVVMEKPKARMNNDGWTAEVSRLATDGSHNVCSFLYARAWEAARALGYRRLITYTFPEEGGDSLRAAGWEYVSETDGGSWHRESRPREDKHDTRPKGRWEKRARTYRRAPRPSVELALVEPEQHDLLPNVA